jgi:asparagine synthase (glutamine-hydrolysing)
MSRTPWWISPPLASVVARFPDQFVTGGKGGKTVLRAAKDKILPPEIVRREKVGLRVPVGEWSKGS